MRTTSTTNETQFVEEVDEVLMDDIDNEIEKRLEGKSKRSGDYLRKIEALMEERRLQRELGYLDDDSEGGDEE
ncbi:MAG TPA: hypothetical protein VFX11_19475 [Candidatus Kapabacteria bacterium]|nr:hypothetical protein [Candidatus Kapabacteria bacterium]